MLVAARGGDYLWTDVAEIRDRALIHTSFADLFAAIVHGVNGHYYRPTVFVLHSLDFLCFGDNPLAFRLTNLLLHAVNAWLVYRLARAVAEDESVSLATAALFAVHPLAATPIDWISDRTDLIALMCSLGFFLLVHRHLATRRALPLTAAALLLALGLGAKETCAASLLVSGALLMRAKPDTRRLLVKVMVVQAAVIAAWFLWRGNVATNSVQRLDQLGAVDRLALASYIHFEYLYQLAFPYLLAVCDGTRVPAAPALWILAAAAGGGAIMVLARRAWRRDDQQTLLALVWAVAFLLPTSGLVALKHVRSDRYLYCALPALLLLIVKAARAGIYRLPQVARRLGVVLFVAAYAYFAISLALRARRFESDETLWTYETERNDLCIEGYANLARAAYNARRLEAAQALSDKVLSQQAADVIAFSNHEWNLYYRGLILIDRGELEPAATVFRDLLEHATLSAIRGEAAYELALLATRRRDYAAVVDFLNRAPSYGSSSTSRGDILLLRSYANLRLVRLVECRRDYEAYLASGATKDTPFRRKLAAEIRAALEVK